MKANEFNRSRIQTVIIAVMTTNTALANAPGNVLLTSEQSGLPKDSVVNVSQLLTIDRSVLTDKISTLVGEPADLVDDGLRLVLGL